MAIMAAQGQNDARAAAWVLATSALRSIEESPDVLPNEIELNNIFKLVESFKLNPLFGVERPPVIVTAGGEALTIGPVAQENTSLVRDAIRCAFNAAFQGDSAFNAVDLIKETLRAVARPHQYSSAPLADKEQVTLFFRELQAALG